MLHNDMEGQLQKSSWWLWRVGEFYIYWIGIKRIIFDMEVLYLCPKNDGNHILSISQEPDCQFSKKLHGIVSNDVSYMIESSLEF